MCSKALRAGKTKLNAKLGTKRAKRKAVAKAAASEPVASGYICGVCGHVCHSQIGLHILSSQNVRKRKLSHGVNVHRLPLLKRILPKICRIISGHYIIYNNPHFN